MSMHTVAVMGLGVRGKIHITGFWKIQIIIK